jgi:hypothetical protein
MIALMTSTIEESIISAEGISDASNRHAPRFDDPQELEL